MKQEGWRTLRSLQAASAPPEVAAAPATGSGARAVPVGQRLVSGMWHYLVGVRSTLAHVEWSVSFIGVLIYLFATTTYRLPVGAAGMAIGIFGLFLLPGGLRFTGSAALFLAFLGWAAVGAIASPWQGVAFEAVLELGKVFMIYLVMVNAIRSRAQVWFFMVAFLALFGSHAVRGTLINYVTGNTYFGRAAWYQGIYGNANDMAALTLL